MENNVIDLDLTDAIVNSVLERMTDETQIFSLDCMKLHPERAAVATAGYELQIFRMNVDDQDVFVLYFDDDSEANLDGLKFYSTDTEAYEALNTEYYRWSLDI